MLLLDFKLAFFDIISMYTNISVDELKTVKLLLDNNNVVTQLEHLIISFCNIILNQNYFKGKGCPYIMCFL